MKHIIIGTAGHVDHGKTALVKTLTGQDTDRLKEEKERGISIELGFASLPLDNGQKVAIIDVPGHERFIKNMLAGVGGIDLVLFIVAADEGVMPQTREHLDIVSLLGINKGIIVVTKSDLVDDEWLELVNEEIREVFIGTTLEEAPMVSVSAIKGTGISKLKELIQEMVSGVQEKSALGKSKLPIDRIFSITGFGTVVTGTLTRGKIKLGDTLEILPEGIPAKVRTLQVHGHKVAEANAGQRVAVNITGVEVQEIKKGSVLTEINGLVPSFRLDCQINYLASAGKKLVNGTRVRIHLGTKEAFGRILILDKDELEPGDQTFMQIVLEEPVVADKNDRFVIRTYSPMVTIAGGIVIDPRPQKHKRFSQQVINSLITKLKGTPDELIVEFLSQTQELILGNNLEKIINLSSEELNNAILFLKNNQSIIVVQVDNKEHYILMDMYNSWIEKIRMILTSFHQEYPLRLGLGKEEVRSRIFSHLSNKQFSHLLEVMSQDNFIKVNDSTVALKEFKPTPTDKQKEKICKIETSFYESGFQPPSWEETVDKFDLNPKERDEILNYLIGEEVLVKVGDLIFHHNNLDKAKDMLIDFLEHHKQVTLGEARDIFNTSRKYMLPLLEYFDRTKITRRIEDKRVLFKVR